MAMLVNPVEAPDLPVGSDRLRRITHEVYVEAKIPARGRILVNTAVGEILP